MYITYKIYIKHYSFFNIFRKCALKGNLFVIPNYLYTHISCIFWMRWKLNGTLWWVNQSSLLGTIVSLLARRASIVNPFIDIRRMSEYRWSSGEREAASKSRDKAITRMKINSSLYICIYILASGVSFVRYSCLLNPGYDDP